MPTITIDGHELEVPDGTNLIEAARQLEIDVPHYCYHPALSVVASCRMCQVELHEADKPPRVVVACRTTAMDGMVVSTRGDDCQKARQATLEFLLANHPLDCPICDKAGECDLQNFSYWHGRGEGRFTEPKRQALKHTPIGNHILLDQERCILCTRCTRFMDEYAQKPQLIVAGRGDRNVITIFPDEPIDSNYEGNLADLCPVGALTLQEFRFRSRVWDLKHADSVCTLCDRGCSIQLETKRNELLRVRPRTNEQVNGHFMCDRGRFGLLEKCNPKERMTEAIVDGHVAAPDAAISALAQARTQFAAHWIVVFSARLTCEEILLARQAFSGVVRDNGMLFVPAAEAKGDGILFTGRESCNEAGLRSLGIEAKTADELSALLADENTHAALFFDHAQATASNAKSNLKQLAVIDLWTGDQAPAKADVAIPGAMFSEKEGTLLNFESVLQRIRRAQRPPNGNPTEGDVLSRLGEIEPMGSGDRTAAVFAEWGLESRTLAQVPPLGMKVDVSGKVPAT